MLCVSWWLVASDLVHLEGVAHAASGIFDIGRYGGACGRGSKDVASSHLIQAFRNGCPLIVANWIAKSLLNELVYEACLKLAADFPKVVNRELFFP